MKTQNNGLSNLKDLAFDNFYELNFSVFTLDRFSGIYLEAINNSENLQDIQNETVEIKRQMKAWEDLEEVVEQIFDKYSFDTDLFYDIMYELEDYYDNPKEKDQYDLIEKTIKEYMKDWNAQIGEWEAE